MAWRFRRRSQRMAPFEIEIRYRQETEKNQWVYDEQHAEARIPSAKMRNAGRRQRNRKTEIRELFHFEWDSRYYERQNTEDLGERELDLEIRGESQVNEGSFGSIGEREMVVEDEVDDAEDHDRQDESCCYKVDQPFSARQLAVCSRYHNEETAQTARM
jgi:hypothetical protein